MKDFNGKIAFITGAGSGAGLGQAKVFAKAGMKVTICDVRRDALHKAVAEIVEYAGCPVDNVLPLCFDLTDRAAYTNAADTVEKVFGGPPHLLIQTAGVNSFGPIEASTFDDFDWVMGVCLDHVVNGLLIFVPRMLKAYGGTAGKPKEEFWVATTSSMGAFMEGSGCGPYSLSKAAVNNMMYSYASALAPYGGGSTVLCPGNINSNIGDAEKYRPEHMRNTGYHVSEGTMKHLRSVHATGIDPVELGEILKEAIESGRIICLPDRNPENWANQLRGNHSTIEDYTLTAAEREVKAAERAEAMRKMFEEMAKNRPEGEAPPAGGGMWAVPEGAERFGMARKDLDFVDPNKKAQ